MKLILKDVLWGILMGLILPGIMLNFAVLLLTQQEQIIAEVTPAAQQTALPMEYQMSDDSAETSRMDAYLVGVVLAEMPAWFEEEALKAQAVVARTYALKARENGGKHGDGKVCTQSGCCQAYISEEAYLQKGGTAENVEKVRRAVTATSDRVLVFHGELIEATYFSCSGGSTEDAVAVWGTDYPYLRAVESPGEEDALHYTDTEFLDADTFCQRLGIHPEGTPENWLEKIAYTSGNGIAEAVIGGKTFTGVQLRSLLSLRSTAISMALNQTGVTITTRGYGHRVGMSQYGADAMAAAGSTYPEILAHYYNGTSLVHYPTYMASKAEETLHDA